MDNLQIMTLGTFQLESTELRVSDPCYNKDTWCAGVLKDCLPGKWESAIATCQDPLFGDRVAALMISHMDSDATCEGLLSSLKGALRSTPFEVGVDSGQAGFFDNSHFKDDTVIQASAVSFDAGDMGIWYAHCCDITLSSAQAGVVPFGVVSSSGFGDGTYDCLYQTDSCGKVTDAIIWFITDDEDEFEDS